MSAPTPGLCPHTGVTDVNNAKLKDLQSHVNGMHTIPWPKGQCPFLAMQTGVRVSDTDHSLKAGVRGGTLLEDQHLREKINHFDHER